MRRGAIRGAVGNAIDDARCDSDCVVGRGDAVSRRTFLTMGAAAAVGLAIPVPQPIPRPIPLSVSQPVAQPATTPAAPQTDRLVTLGQVSLSFYAVTGAVVHEILERLGHRVEVREGRHEEIFPLLGTGAVDLMAAAWLPDGHAAYWSRRGADAMEVATLYDDARFFWAVPRHVPEHEVASIADLATPRVARRMTTTIQSIGAGAAITQVSQAAIREYGLAAAGYEVRPGTPAEWTAAYEAARAGRRWMVFPTWAPQYLNRGGDLRPLADPRRVLGGANRGVLVAPIRRFQALPERTRQVLSRITLGLDGVTEMDWAVNVSGQTPRDAARAWMRANDARVRAWLDTAGPRADAERAARDAERGSPPQGGPSLRGGPSPQGGPPLQGAARMADDRPDARRHAQHHARHHTPDHA